MYNLAQVLPLVLSNINSATDLLKQCNGSFYQSIVYTGLWQHPTMWWNPQNLHLPSRFAMDRDLTCAEQNTRLPALPGWSLIGPPDSWDAFNCTLCFLICTGTLSNVHPHSTGMWSRLQASLLVTQNVRRWECYILWGQRCSSSRAHLQIKNWLKSISSRFHILVQGSSWGVRSRVRHWGGAWRVKFF